ncbi:MAG: ABC transporter substrate-binding protein [Oscillospiraceae bacterium]|nr:ABC transporter substrate-binding protein [Oscillospiraceae bacterium]
MKRLLSLLLTLTLSLSLIACGSSTSGNQNSTTVSPQTPPAQSTTEATDSDALVLSNAILGENHDFTYSSVPQRVVTLASPATEMLLALGVEQNIVGYAMQENEIPAQYKAAFDALHCITEDWNVSQEMILALEPDFMMFWNGSPNYTYDFLTTNNISTYTMTSDIDGAKIASVYDDFTNMGKIFGVEERAAEIISQMRAKIDPVAEKTATLSPVSVAYIDAYSSEESAFTAGDALVADIFRTAGGANVISNTTDPWLNVSWEEIAAADPEWIVIGVYEGVEDADFWKDFLRNHPACSQMRAVQNENFIVTGLVDLTVGERIADTVGMLAEQFHPEA